MTITIIILSILTVGSLFGTFLTLSILFNLQKQYTVLYKLYKGLGKRLDPIRLHFLQVVYNSCVEDQDYENANEILNIIKDEYPDEYKRRNPNRSERSGGPASWML